MSTLRKDLAELESVEDFLGYFGIEFDPAVVQVNRLHILQRFHDYLYKAKDTMSQEENAQKGVYASLLQRAYQDFVKSDA